MRWARLLRLHINQPDLSKDPQSTTGTSEKKVLVKSSEKNVLM